MAGGNHIWMAQTSTVIILNYGLSKGFPAGPSGKKKKNLPTNAGDIRNTGLIRGSGRFSGGGHGPGEPHGQRSLTGCSPWGRIKSDTTEVTQHACIALSSCALRLLEDRKNAWAILFWIINASILERNWHKFLFALMAFHLFFYYSKYYVLQ